MLTPQVAGAASLCGDKFVARMKILNQISFLFSLFDAMRSIPAVFSKLD